MRTSGISKIEHLGPLYGTRANDLGMRSYADDDEFLHVLEDTFSHDEVWPQACDHLYVSLRSGRSVGEDPNANPDTGPAPQSDTEPAAGPEELEPLPTDEVTEDLHEPALHVDDACNEIPDQSVDPDDLPQVDMDRPLQVTFGKEHRYAPTLMELIHCRRNRDGTLQPMPLPKVGPNTPYPSSLFFWFRHW